jgi:iron complex outermembrane receptor protein
MPALAGGSAGNMSFWKLDMDIKETSGNQGQNRTRYRKAWLLGCTTLVALAPTYSLAQQAENSDASIVLETVTVEGTGADNDAKSIVATETTAAGKMPTNILEAPASVSVITSKEIQERDATSIEQVVQYTAGVVTDFYGSDDRYDYFDIRGFTPYTYRDGLVIGRTFGGTREEPYAFERIEVLKGANSSGFGASEPGGLVNYVTKKPKSERFGEVYVTGGSFKHAETGFDFGDNITVDNTLSYRLTGKFQDANAEYDYSRDDEKFIMGGLTWRPSDATNLTVVFDHLHSNGVPGSGGHPKGTDFDRDRFFGEPGYYFNDTDRNTVSIMFDHDFGNGLSFGSNARYSKSDNAFGSAYIGNTRTDGSNLADRYFFGNDKSSNQFIVDAHLRYETSFNDVESRTLVGAEYNKFKSEGESIYTAAPPINWENPVYSGGPGVVAPYASVRNDQKTTAIYLQQDLTFFDKLTATVGLRNDWLDIGETDLLADITNTSNISEFTKRFGLSYKITDELAVFTNYAESAAPPDVGTEPTTGKQYEAGIKYQPEAFPAIFTASIYDLTKENITVFDDVLYLPSTVEKVRHRGFEFEAKAEVTDNINVIAAYSYIDSKIEEPGGANDGNRLMRVPEHFASVWGTYTLPGEGPRGDMTFGLGARYIGAYFVNIENTRSSESAVVFDAAFTYKIQENTTFQLNASNLFDEKHLASEDAGGNYYNPGRAVFATLRQTW